MPETSRQKTSKVIFTLNVVSLDLLIVRIHFTNVDTDAHTVGHGPLRSLFTAKNPEWTALTSQQSILEELSDHVIAASSFSLSHSFYLSEPPYFQLVQSYLSADDEVQWVKHLGYSFYGRKGKCTECTKMHGMKWSKGTTQNKNAWNNDIKNNNNKPPLKKQPYNLFRSQLKETVALFAFRIMGV